jgi:hypothetical protein
MLESLEGAGAGARERGKPGGSARIVRARLKGSGVAGPPRYLALTLLYSAFHINTIMSWVMQNNSFDFL